MQFPHPGKVLRVPYAVRLQRSHHAVPVQPQGVVSLQSVWSGDRRLLGTFLHSPMLDELKSLEAMLIEKVRTCWPNHHCRGLYST